jgi:hypothetical protein
MAVYLRHATHRQNLDSIKSAGLRKVFAQGALKACWLHSASNSAWAAMHVARRHGWAVEDVVIVTVRVPRAWLKRTATRGLWYVPGDLPAGTILGHVPASEAIPAGIAS